MTLTFSLDSPRRTRDRLEAIVAAGETVTPDELDGLFRADRAETARLERWLRGRGFTKLHVSGDGTRVTASASGAVVAKSLGVSIVVRKRGRRAHLAAVTAPRLPTGLASNLHVVLGLDPSRRARRRPSRGPSVAAVSAVSAASTEPPSALTPPYLVSAIRRAYGADRLPFTGKGTTIAVLIDHVPDPEDLVATWKAHGVSTDLSRVTRVVVGRARPPTSDLESTIDVAWVSTIAPDAAVRVYEVESFAFHCLDAGLHRIQEDAREVPTMRQLSMSFGLGERYMTRGEVRAQHARLLRLAALGINVFVSSGDAGPNPDPSGHASTGPTQAEYAASDPCVVGVGGTTLAFAPDGGRIETPWADSGRGSSAFPRFRRPVWQRGAGLPPGDRRVVPDVACAADAATGGLLVWGGSTLPIGGTSWSAPMWAGFCALLNEARAASGRPPLAFLNPSLYPLLGTDAFHGVGAASGGARGASGYDAITGLGTPNLAALVRALVPGPGRRAVAPRRRAHRS